MVKSRIHRILAVTGLSIAALVGLGCWFQLQSAFTNVGQEFGAYGQYNRVLNVIKGMDEFEIIKHRVRRKLTLMHIFRVEEFSIRLKDRAGREGEIWFVKGSPEMTEKDRDRLKEYVVEKFRAAPPLLEDATGVDESGLQP